TTAPPDATSTLLAIKFTSDGSVTAPGWSATWSTDGTVNQPPTVAITAPADGSTVSGEILISADAADADGTVARVSFGLPDGSTIDDDTAPYELAWDSSTVADGPAAITATAFDNVGASAAATVNVTVENGTGCVNGTFAAADVPRAIPDNSPAGIRSYVNVEGAGNVGTIRLSMAITHTYIGDLKVVLVAPSGEARYVVHNRSGGSADNINISDLELGVFAGQPANGQWRLRVIDLAGYDTGTLDSWSLTITGDCDGGGGWGASADPNLPTQDNGQVCSTVTVSGKGEASAAKLDLSGTHDWRSILRGTLEHNGTVVEAFPVGTFPSQAGGFELTNHPVAGIEGNAEGDWTLCIIDTDGYGDTGVLAHWAVHE
ncbi:MAG TPA: proprotein convertase P-domain-containing protein, partial [Kofleriaceae bacterium]|nr:proprotein convertase P-domain-containing protein [Kofleriaceae bacterium]